MPAGAPKKAVAAAPTAPAKPRRSAGKLSYKDQRELDALPAHIETLEAEQETLHNRMAESGFYRQDGETIAAARQRLEEVGMALQRGYARWEELESMKSP